MWIKCRIKWEVRQKKVSKKKNEVEFQRKRKVDVASFEEGKKIKK